MRIYVAGPMRGIKDYNFPAFAEAEKTLEAKGHEVINPVSIGNKFGTPEEIENDETLRCRVMDEELKAIDGCDAIYLLVGWSHSAGACREFNRAIDGSLAILEEQVDVIPEAYHEY